MVTDVAQQTPEQKLVAQLVRSNKRMEARILAIVQTIKKQREAQLRLHEQFEKDMAARRRKGVFTSSEARRWAVFTLVSSCSLSFVLGCFIKGIIG